MIPIWRKSLNLGQTLSLESCLRLTLRYNPSFKQIIATLCSLFRQFTANIVWYECYSRENYWFWIIFQGSSPPKVISTLSPIGAFPATDATSLPPVVIKLINYLKKEQQVSETNLGVSQIKINMGTYNLQVKYYLRQLGKPVDGIGNKPLALRGAVTTLADVTDFTHDLGAMDIKTVRKPSIR